MKEKRSKRAVIVVVSIVLLGLVSLAAVGFEEWIKSGRRPDKITPAGAVFKGVNNKDKINDAKSNFLDWIEDSGNGYGLDYRAWNCVLGVIPEDVWLDVYETKSFYRATDWANGHHGSAQHCI